MAEISVNPEKRELATFTDVVVIRPPSHIPKTELESFISKLSNKGLLPVVQPHQLSDSDPEDDKWFPTDDIREVGSHIFVNGGSNFRVAIKSLEDVIGKAQTHAIESRVLNFPLNGGNYLHAEHGKIFVYAEDQVMEGYSRDDDWYKADHALLNQRLAELHSKGWKTHATTIDGREKTGINDLDFLMSLFEGKDGKVHALAAESFADRVPSNLVTHVISDDEAIKGGCNIADLKKGSLLVVQNAMDVPVTTAILNEYASADIIATPKDFLEGGGGPRCSISSFSLR